MEVGREIGDIAVSPQVHALLVGLRAIDNTTVRPELELQKVVDVERAFAIRFHDDLVATWAARVPLLGDRYGLTVGGVVAHTGGLADLKVRGDYIGLARLDAGRILAIEKGAATDELVVIKDRQGVARRYSLASWLEATLSEVGGAPGHDPSFSPRLFRPLPMSNAPGRRVRHAKFGDGKVLREVGDGPTRKVHVDFYKVGLKLLQGRFIEYVDED